MTEAQRPRSDAQERQSFSNVARDESQVGAQFGFVIGDVHMYDVREDRPPVDKYRVALQFLRASMGRRAEGLIGQAVEAGFVSDSAAGFSANHVAYHWVLAVLSGRSFEQLGSEELANIDFACHLIDQDHRDGWLDAIDVICRLLKCRERQEQTHRPNAEFDVLLTEYRALSDNCREDFRRHLNMILEGGIQDQLEAAIAEEVRTLRMSSAREQRAWKFFEPTPAPPRPKPPEKPVLGLAGWVKAVVGLILGSAGVVLALYIILSASISRAAVVALLIVGGGVVAARSGIALFAARGRLADKERAYGYPILSRYSNPQPRSKQPPVPDIAEDGKEDADEARQLRAKHAGFVRVTSRHIDEQFVKHTPSMPSSRRKWELETARIRATLKKEIIDCYSNPETEPGGINWLATWRVKEIARRWHEGTLHDYRGQIRPRTGTMAVLAAGMGLWLIGLVTALVETFRLQISVGLIATILLALSCLFLVPSALDVYLVRWHRLPADRIDANKRLQEERQEYRRWQNELRNRPHDDEMALWLDYDKIYIKTLAVKHLGLVGRDIVTQAILTAAAPGCRGARIVHGPPRYSAYIVTIFLLTDSGVRHVSVHLNFENGIASNQERTSFRYDAIASANVKEVGVRFDKSRQALLAPESDCRDSETALASTPPDDRPRGRYGSLTLRQEFRLSLVNGQDIGILVETFDGGFRDLTLEDSRNLLELALETSGISSALRVLEAIAAQGREWLVQEQIRRRRHVPDIYVAAAMDKTPRSGINSSVIGDPLSSVPLEEQHTEEASGGVA